MSILIGVLFFVLVELNEDPNVACKRQQEIIMLPEMCHAEFNREQ